MTATPQDPAARLVRAAIQLDANMNAEERCPTGDDYNALFALIRGLLVPLSSKTPEQAPGKPTVYECEECDWTGTLDTINGIHHLHQIQERIEPGELVPAGACPDCGALIGVDDADVPHHTLYAIGLIMRQRGWTVATPADCPPLPAVTEGETAVPHLAVVGRIDGDDEDSVELYTDIAPDVAAECFKQDMQEGRNTGCEVYVNYVLISPAPITIAQRNV